MKSYLLLGMAGVLGASCWLQAADKVTTTKTETITTETKTVITENVVTEEREYPLIKACVLDFTTVDSTGDKMLDNNTQRLKVPAQSTLNSADRDSMDSIMQGYVRMIDAQVNGDLKMEEARENNADYEEERARTRNLYNTVVNGKTRPVVIGAEYLSAYLGHHNDVFVCTEPNLILAAMARLQSEKDFPKDFLARLGKVTGATHLIYGTVSDLRTKVNSFKGYGIETKTTTFQLDVIIRVVDLAAQHVVFSNVYTGTCREQRPVSVQQFDSDIFQTLMTAALQQAAEELYEVSLPGDTNRIRVTELPESVKDFEFGASAAAAAAGKAGAAAGQATGAKEEASGSDTTAGGRSSRFSDDDFAGGNDSDDAKASGSTRGSRFADDDFSGSNDSDDAEASGSTRGSRFADDDFSGGNDTEENNTRSRFDFSGDDDDDDDDDIIVGGSSKDSSFGDFEEDQGNSFGDFNPDADDFSDGKKDNVESGKAEQPAADTKKEDTASGQKAEEEAEEDDDEIPVTTVRTLGGQEEVGEEASEPKSNPVRNFLRRFKKNN